MAQRVQTLIVSDLSGEELGGGGETHTFTYRGVDYEIDVSPDESAEFDEVMAKYIQHGRRVGGRSQTRAGKTPGKGKEELDAIRSWARENGHQVSDRGRISKKVQDAYTAAH
ncbi:MAG: histone-like nucleoid-structuring protein Lsr2 [Euzebya sp.]